MSRPPLCTLAIDGIAHLGPAAVLGIDTAFFTVTPSLKGIKRIPPGLHILHYTQSAEDGVSMRYAWWFCAAEGDIVRVRLAGESAVFTYDVASSDDGHNASSALCAEIGDAYQMMVSFPEDAQKWASLAKYIDSEALDEFLHHREQAVSTATPLAEENMVLMDILRSRKQDIDVADQSHDELRYTIIEMQKKRANASGAQLTRDALDRSWQLLELYGPDPELLLAEIQLAYVHFVVLCNLCSYTQWMALLALVLRSKTLLRGNGAFAEKFLAVFAIQLATVPPEYVVGALGVQVVETARMEAILGDLGEVCEGRVWQNILQSAKGLQLHVEPRSRLDDDRFEVYDIGTHDAEDEDAPAIVY